MPHIQPKPLADIDPILAQAIIKAKKESVLSTTLPVQIWSHRPDTAQAWLATLSTFYNDSLMSERLRELVRLKIASITRCQACQLARKSNEVSEEDLACLAADSENFSPAEQAALSFAEHFAQDYTVIDSTHFDGLREFFSDEAIVELNMFCGLMLAGGRMTYVLKGYEDEA